MDGLSTNGFNIANTSRMSSMFEHGLPYSTKMRAHSSCINALAFSSQGGRFLASGGDDLQIHIWDFHQEEATAEPCHTFRGPRNNIFCLEFSSHNQYLFAGGTDNIVHQFDVSRLESGSLNRNEQLPTALFREDDTIRDVTCHPFHDEVFLSGSDNGRIIQHDSRIKHSTNPTPRAADIIQLVTEVTSVKFHPTVDHLFATSDSKGNVCLRDTRMAFGPRKGRTKNGIVRTFHTTISRPNVETMSSPEPSSLAFDRQGEKLAVTLLHYYPTIYSLSDSHPIAICTGRNTVEGKSLGQRTYSNSCTMKHGCFGSPGLVSGDDYYCSGSDNFCAYLWKIPSVEHLVEERKEISSHEWQLSKGNTVAFTAGLESPKFIPTEISTPSAILKGHNSIVNTTLIHPYFPLILTAGIERTVTLHSPLPSCPFSQQLSLTPQEVRQLPNDTTIEEARVIDSLLLGLSDPADRNSPDEAELDTIRLFDRILRIEGEADPFDVRPWYQVSAEQTSDSDSDILESD
ncbi:WD40-repeat-containing domain protein [Rhodocollybia butyracea]|uniref:WD40-repeat-containing domain protein n=1 Tax=Rhodocollybia butyracea TaxID=206335 RepID=A0A9P5PE12_9AGAR|nr:WD40-repeat-containing domain protein [Rhodocollybia butyracea]